VSEPLIVLNLDLLFLICSLKITYRIRHTNWPMYYDCTNFASKTTTGTLR